MSRPSSFRFPALVLTLCAAAGLTSFAPRPDFGVAAASSRPVAQGIPARISDQAFWRMIKEFSEDGGYFQSDNFVSNETTFQYVIPTLLQKFKPGGVYLGVGPDQNFTYIVALQPRISFIIDIRPGAMYQHLMYKALIEMSRDRVEFLSLLFSRARPAGLSDTSAAFTLLQAFLLQPPDSATYFRNLEAIRNRLTKVHGFALSNEDFAQVEYVYTSFYQAGPDITYNYGSGRGGFGRGMPSYAMLMVEDDGQGKQRSYIASEENFRVLKDLQSRNLIVPLVGDFAGPKALRAVGQYLREHGATVSAIYTSNVEQYLFRGADDWRRYYASVATLPVDTVSTFIRAVFNYPGIRSATPTPGPRSITLLCPVVELVKAFNEGRILGYNDVVNMSR